MIILRHSISDCLFWSQIISFGEDGQEVYWPNLLHHFKVLNPNPQSPNFKEVKTSNAESKTENVQHLGLGFDLGLWWLQRRDSYFRSDPEFHS